MALDPWEFEYSKKGGVSLLSCFCPVIHGQITRNYVTGPFLAPFQIINGCPLVLSADILCLIGKLLLYFLSKYL